MHALIVTLIAVNVKNGGNRFSSFLVSGGENENWAATRPKLDDFRSFGILAF